jgi:hypothetical protein
MKLAEHWPAVLGAVLGALVSGYALIYVPMKSNYDRNGCVWLECPSSRNAQDKERG